MCACAAVRTGNLAKFNQVLEQFGEKFQTDGTYTLIIRLRHNVIKTGEPVTAHLASHITPDPWTGILPCVCVCAGVRMISLSYSRISLADIAQKLQLDSPEDAEFIVAKVTPPQKRTVWLNSSQTSGTERAEDARSLMCSSVILYLPLNVWMRAPLK